ncbi:MAG: hypothetical protein HYR86_14025 [Candidatus Rokubacteria bacterium]|nr:hypothetical protein [Candidatus Rokubacteria bacterium]
MLEQVRSGLSLGWGVLCLELYGVPAARHARALARAWEATRFLGDTKTIALAVLALSDGAAVFIAPERARGG